MYVSVSHIPCTTPEEAAALDARFASRPHLVDHHPGFRSFESLRPQVGPSRLGTSVHSRLVVTCWDDEASFESWIASAAMRLAHSGARPGPGDRRSWHTSHEPCEAVYTPNWQETVAGALTPVALLNVVVVASEATTSFEEFFRTCQQAVDVQRGFLTLEVLRPVAGTWTDPPREPSTDYSPSPRTSGPDRARIRALLFG